MTEQCTGRELGFERPGLNMVLYIVVYINLLFSLNPLKILFAYRNVLCICHAVSVPLYPISFRLRNFLKYFQFYVLLPFHSLNLGLFVPFFTVPFTFTFYSFFTPYVLVCVFL